MNFHEKYYMKGGNIMLLTPGPINKDYTDGELTNWHLEALNNSENTVNIYFSLYALSPMQQPIPLGTTSTTLEPGVYTFLNLLVLPLSEHTIPVIEIPSDEILVTLYGRNDSFQEITGAIFNRSNLIQLSKPLLPVGTEV
ncbi:MAG: hypothetical protein K0S01_2475 [Herbinix sp.]|jgi:hypothetical protein|nr:hypothetical protein [Herbinix sp.]